MEITLNELAIAYRKVKADLYYSSVPCRARIVQFEKNLDQRLLWLKEVLGQCDFAKVEELCYGYLIVPKHVKFKDEQLNSVVRQSGAVVYSSPSLNKTVGDVAKAEFRVMADLPIEFHVIMTWWILQIGEKYERLVSEDSYGNRIRRNKDNKVNRFSIGTFVRYLPQYKSWRDNGIRAIRRTIDEGEDVVAVTADFVSFYHKIDPSFLLDPLFYDRLGDRVEGLSDELRYTELVVKMLRKWAGSTPLGQGLPVGCSISSVIANLALIEFDKKIRNELSPIYYGRYVDDIIIVMRNASHFSDAASVWEWMAKRVDGLLVRSEDIAYNDQLVNKISQLAFSFEKSKTKVFIVDHDSGALLLDALEAQIRERSSEWRSLPDIPLEDRSMAAKILSACNAAGDASDNLRKVDSVSLKRAVFAMTVRDFEAYGRNLCASAWSDVRLSFLRMIDKHFTDISSFFDLHGYLSRIISCACANCSLADESTFKIVSSIIKKMFEVVNRLRSVPNTFVLAGLIADDSNTRRVGYRSNDIANALSGYLIKLFDEAIVSAVSDPIVLSSLKNHLIKENPILHDLGCELTYSELVHADLALLPTRLLAAKPRKRLRAIEDNHWWRAISGFYSWMSKNDVTNGAPLAMFFPTRPFNAYELSEMGLNSYLDDGCRSKLEAFLIFSRGYGCAKGEHLFPTWDSEKYNYIKVAWQGVKPDVTVALANWLTTRASCEAVIRKAVDEQQGDRYNRLMRLINEILASGVKVDYVVFPEMSIPSQWFRQIALKLRNSKISLIAGVEYLHEDDDKVRNQVWCSLLFDGCGFTDVVVYKFEKARPAIHEAERLRSVAGLAMTSSVLDGSQPEDRRPVVVHGDLKKRHFDFSSITCSDLTNIEYRAQLRGQVDAIFIPAWNRDEDMFASLVESAAYDVHAYMVECNNREHSDTRIRVPAKKSYERDLVRIKGGIRDYYVIGRLDIDKLRRFQDNVVSPTGEDVPFKPVPIGYRMADWRKVKAI